MSKLNSCELAFRDYCNYHRYSFVFLNQETDTFSVAFKENGIKRVDFMISFSLMGIQLHIYADTKQRQFNKKFSTFTVSEDDVQALHNFKLKFHNTVVFIILSNGDSGFRTFYVICIEDIIKKCELRINKENGKEFRAIKITECNTLGWNDGFEQILKL